MRDRETFFVQGSLFWGQICGLWCGKTSEFDFFYFDVKQKIDAIPSELSVIAPFGIGFTYYILHWAYGQDMWRALCCRFFHHIVNGVDYFHGQNVIHRVRKLTDVCHLFCCRTKQCFSCSGHHLVFLSEIGHLLSWSHAHNLAKLIKFLVFLGITEVLYRSWTSCV